MPGSFLLAGLFFGLDSFLVSVPLGAMALSRARRRRLALAFGACDGLATGLGGLLPLAGVRFFSGELEWIAPTLIAVYGFYVMALGLQATCHVSRGNASRLAFALPVLLSLDNFIGGGASWINAPEGVAGAVVMGAISGGMSLAGLAVGAILRHCVNAISSRFDRSSDCRWSGRKRSAGRVGGTHRMSYTRVRRLCSRDARRCLPVRPRLSGGVGHGTHSSGGRRKCPAQLAGGLFLLAALAMYCVEWLG
jgi:putative Mn2+ efflux pump MntP